MAWKTPCDTHAESCEKETIHLWPHSEVNVLSSEVLVLNLSTKLCSSNSWILTTSSTTFWVCVCGQKQKWCLCSGILNRAGSRLSFCWRMILLHVRILWLSFDSCYFASSLSLCVLCYFLCPHFRTGEEEPSALGMPINDFVKIRFPHCKKTMIVVNRTLGLLFHSNPQLIMGDSKVLNDLMFLHVQRSNLTALQRLLLCFVTGPDVCEVTEIPLTTCWI